MYKISAILIALALSTAPFTQIFASTDEDDDQDSKEEVLSKVPLGTQVVLNKITNEYVSVTTPGNANMVQEESDE